MKLKKTALIFAVLAAAYGCTPTPKTGYLVPDTRGPKGYEVVAGAGVVENEFARLSASQVRKGEETSPLLASLLEKNYIIMNLSIENLSDRDLIYKPNLTAIDNDAFDFIRPLDYTDIYGLGDMEGLEAIRHRFYDLDTTLRPGQQSKKLLIFRPLSKNVKKAVLRIDDLYIGTDYIRVTIPFVFKAEN